MKHIEALKDYTIKYWSDLKYILLIIATVIIYFFFNRPFWYKPYNFKIALDDSIPLIPATVLIYHIWYPSLLATLFYYVGVDKVHYYKTLLSLFLGDVISLITYIFFQNEVVRDPITTSDIFSKLLIFTRNSDNPYNGLPSMHVLACTILIISYLSLKIKPKYKFGLILLQIGIIISTLTTKQHFVLDIVFGILIGIISNIIISVIISKKQKRN